MAVRAVANADGGYILFGVKDRQECPTTSTHDNRIIGVPLESDPLKHFQDKVKGILPNLYYEPTPTPIRLPSADTKGIFVVHIPQSPKRPHMDESAGIVYWHGPGGAAEATTPAPLSATRGSTYYCLVGMPPNFAPSTDDEPRYLTTHDGHMSAGSFASTTPADR
ncbi:MAG: helix-turn-helix domain-containing protein [Ktedonobacterales bacterium]